MRRLVLFSGVAFVALAGALLISSNALAAPKSEIRSVRALAVQIDNQVTGGFYQSGGRSIADVLAIWKVESNFDFNAIGDLNLPDKSWGIGQVRGTTAADFGVSDARQLLDPYKGAEVSMRYWQWAHGALARRLGRLPTKTEWVASYNAGVGGVSGGFIPSAYVARWQAARAVL